MDGQPVSMIEPRHDVLIAQNSVPAKRRNFTPIIVISICIGLLIILTVALLILVKNGGNISSYRYLPEYKKTYRCATDEYNYRDGVFDVQLELKEDNTYKFSIMNEQFILGSFNEDDQTYAKTEDGANEINYHLTLKTKQTFLNNKDITEAPGAEEHYAVNINEKSDVIVLINSDADAEFYCVVR